MEAGLIHTAPREGWESRLACVIEEFRHAPYVLGHSDCLRLACAAVEAVTGTDFWRRFAGYTTRRQALVTIARIAPSLGEAVTRVLGRQPIDVRATTRGDLVLFRDDDGEDHLGVVVGRDVALYDADGLRFVSRDTPGLLLAWGVH